MKDKSNWKENLNGILVISGMLILGILIGIVFITEPLNKWTNDVKSKLTYAEYYASNPDKVNYSNNTLYKVIYNVYSKTPNLTEMYREKINGTNFVLFAVNHSLPEINEIEKDKFLQIINNTKPEYFEGIEQITFIQSSTIYSKTSLQNYSLAWGEYIPYENSLVIASAGKSIESIESTLCHEIGHHLIKETNNSFEHEIIDDIGHSRVCMKNDYYNKYGLGD